MGVRLLTWVFAAEGGATVIIVEHIGGKRSFNFVAVGVFDDLPFSLLLLCFALFTFAWAA